MLRKKLPFLLVALLFEVTSGMAQSQPSAAPMPPSPDPSYQQVSVPVPRAVSLLTDVVRVLVSRNNGQDKVQTLLNQRRERTKEGNQNIIFSLPKNRLTRTLGLVE